MNSISCDPVTVETADDAPGSFGVPLDTRQHGQATLAQRLKRVHEALRNHDGLAPLQRIAIATYDSSTDTIKTFADSTIGTNPLGHYEVPLARLGSLSQAARTRVIRVVDVMTDGGSDAPAHVRELYRCGLRSSLTVPIYDHGRLFGFVFFNAAEPAFFRGAVADRLSPYMQLIAVLAINQFMTVRLVRAVAKTAQEVTRQRDLETSTHLERMSHYARAVALEGAKDWALSDEFIEHLFWFSPLHDIGKVAVPDSLLLKPAKLTEAETREMQQHVAKGGQMVDAIVREFGMDQLPNIGMLHNIIAFHHENVDGSGYPARAAGDAIPIEGRITAVADVFDALTSDRPYKRKWSNEAALGYMRGMAGRKFDPACIDMLGRRMTDVVEIQRRFEQDVDF
ncbi:MAG TPA: HD domain-containing phosphohydrolase [Candidatus Sulfotelmatobacter sp.]|nr:HD domain-containing phosphohydrolase [Candidatus Sulfotelmatobacter sp.]